jgi:hypothetical protein
MKEPDLPCRTSLGRNRPEPVLTAASSQAVRILHGEEAGNRRFRPEADIRKLFSLGSQVYQRVI